MWTRIVVALACGAPVGALWPNTAAAIPVFARIYGKPCHACHTMFPQLNVAGEALRAHGLHGLKPAIEPLTLGPLLSVPGTLPLALSFSVGEDVTEVNPPGPKQSTRSQVNMEFLSLLAGGELGPYLSFFADYAPIVTNTVNGDIQPVQTRPGLAFVQAHDERAGWLGNLRLGLFELPVGTSPRVHRLSTRAYLIYSMTAFRLLGRPPKVTDNRTDTFVLSSAQIGAEFSALNEATGLLCAAGFDSGSNNRRDNNSSYDFFARLGLDRGARRAGLFFYYSPDILGNGGNDEVFRFGPDYTLTSRRVRITAQSLAGYDSNPTNRSVPLWYYGGFVEGDYRLTPSVMSLLRLDYTGMPQFNDRPEGGTSHVHRHLWEVTGGAQYLIRENLKLVAELTYSENHEGVSNTTVTGWTGTMRFVTAFWPLTPPLLSDPAEQASRK